jgi:formate dehydrogenase maturation protein FdhE
MRSVTTDELGADRRIARARMLTSAHPAAAEALLFYATLAGYQKAIAPDDGQVRPLEARRPDGSSTFLGIIDVDPVLDAIPGFLAWLPGAAPAGLAQGAGDLDDINRSAWERLLREYLAGGDDDPEDADPVLTFVLESVLQPAAERLAVRLRAAGARESSSEHHGQDWATRGSGPSRCPFCGSRLVVAVLREESHGARRSLVCALCLHEWSCRRVVCAECGEQQFDVLPVYTTDRFAHVRIDACDRCHRYMKTIDMTKDGHAIPCVDDIASLALDLWARDQGYARVKRNLLGF